MKAEQRKKKRISLTSLRMAHNTMCEQGVYWQKWQRAQNNQNIINLQSIFYRDNGVVAIDSIICHAMSHHTTHHNLKAQSNIHSTHSISDENYTIFAKTLEFRTQSFAMS